MLEDGEMMRKEAEAETLLPRELHHDVFLARRRSLVHRDGAAG